MPKLESKIRVASFNDPVHCFSWPFEQTIVDGFADVAHLLEPKKFSVPFPLLSPNQQIIKVALTRSFFHSFTPKRLCSLSKLYQKSKLALLVAFVGKKPKESLELSAQKYGHIAHSVHLLKYDGITIDTVWLTYPFDSGFYNFAMKKGALEAVFIIK